MLQTVKKFYNSKAFDIILTILITLGVIYLLVINFVGSVSHVQGMSMDPTLKDNQNIIYRKSYGNFKRFDIALLTLGNKLSANDENYPTMHNENIVKRIIGFENEEIKIDGEKLYVNNKEIKQNFPHRLCEGVVKDARGMVLERNICNQTYIVPKGYVYVLGDNRSGSTDSRFIGAVKKD